MAIIATVRARGSASKLRSTTMRYKQPELSAFARSHLERVLTELLDPVDCYTASRGGPEGPWDYGSLTVTRILNTIYVRNVDGTQIERLNVTDCSEYDNPRCWLGELLDELNYRSLENL